MIINEIFYSIQGEGQLAGMPSIFIRLPGCPLRCQWCDTKYAWPSDAGREYSIDELNETIRSHPTRHIVITGGEPMTNPDFADFIGSLAIPNMHITIETSGISFIPDLPCGLMSISPKLSNSTPTHPDAAAEHEKNRLNMDALQDLINAYDYQLKFVVDAPADFNEIAECLEKLGNINPERVYLMPQAATRDQYISKSQMVAEFSKQTGFPISQRLQLLLWDNQKGK